MQLSHVTQVIAGYVASKAYTHVFVLNHSLQQLLISESSTAMIQLYTDIHVVCACATVVAQRIYKPQRMHA